jgi:hypothetical protein
LLRELVRGGGLTAPQADAGADLALGTVFGFIAQPKLRVFLKPLAMKTAACKLGYEFPYRSRPTWGTYGAYLQMAKRVHQALADDHPRDMIDVQAFLWVLGSDEYN